MFLALPELRTREERSNQYFGTDLMPVDSQAVDDLDEIYERVSAHFLCALNFCYILVADSM